MHPNIIDESNILQQGALSLSYQGALAAPVLKDHVCSNTLPPMVPLA
jgi:hypothetical protein